MRVHPYLLTPKAYRWQLPSAVALVLLLITLNAIPRRATSTIAPPGEELVDAFVVTRDIEAGAAIDPQFVQLTKIPARSVPNEAVTSLRELRDKIAIGPLMKGYPLSRSVIGESLPLIPVSDDSQLLDDLATDPVDNMLAEIRKTHVSMTIKNDGADLKRGDRIALLLAIDGQDSAVLVDEAWVGEASKASVVTYVLPYQVEIIKTAKQFGTLSIVGLPESARNIYEGRAVKSAADLLAQIKNITGQSTMVAANSTKSSRRFPSYAWIRGAGIRYGIESNGDMYIVDSTGKEAIAPLMPKME